MKRPAFITCFLSLTLAPGAFADLITFTGSSGSLATSVTFTVSGTNLLVKLVNTSTGNPADPTDILSSVVWDMTGTPTLGKVSANSCPTCTIKNGGPGGAGGDVGGEWGYLAGVLGSGVTQQEGLSSMGGGNFGVNTRFNTNELAGPPSGSLAGIQYGITTTTDAAGNDNGGISGEFFEVNEVDFVLSGLAAGFSAISGISNVRFQYGTDFSETHFSGTPTTTAAAPEPGALVLLASCVAIGFGSRWKRQALRS